MIKTFTMGGTHPLENKITAKNQIIIFPLPDRVFIPLSQHIGAPAKPIVKRGDIVKVGDLIGEKVGAVSSNIHSSISGTVEKIDKIIDSNGYKKEMIIIKRDGDNWNDNCNNIPLKQKTDITSSDILSRIEAAGIVGMGGAAFPTHIKLNGPENKIKTVIINGVECEPFLTSDHRLMLEKSSELISGIELLIKVTGAKSAIIGIENNKKDAIDHLRYLTNSIKDIEVVPLKVKYPQGGEKQLIKALLNLEVPSGKLPLNVGVVVQNVGTAVAVHDAVFKNIPLIERVVTISGDNLEKTGNFLVRLGTPISDILNFCGYTQTKASKILNGGPMMGRSLVSIDAPIVKGSSGILTFNESSSKRVEPTPCIKCADCVSVCPMGLTPMHLSRLVKIKNIEETKQFGILDCIECGCCQFTCPAFRPLLDNIRLGKIKVRQL